MGAGDKFVAVRGSADLLFTPAQVAATVGGGGGGNVAPFSTFGVAQAAIIPDTTAFVSVAGFKVPGDGGAGTYAKLAGPLPAYYVGDGSTPPLLPPNFTTGYYPINVFSTTWAGHAQAIFGSTLAIVAGFLTVIVVLNGLVPPPATVTDSVGNTYLLATHLEAADTSYAAALYYCTNPVFAPIGTTFNVGATDRLVYVYCILGFTGAVLDKTVTQLSPSSPGGITLPSGVLTASPEFVIGAIMTGRSPIGDNSPGMFYSLPTGWLDIMPPTTGRNPIACTVAPTTAGVSFAPTWVGAPQTSTILATFKTFPVPALDGSFWSLMPTFPLHSAQYGIDPATLDNLIPFQNFGKYLASLAPPSGETYDPLQQGYDQPVTITIANPAVITVQNNKGGNLIIGQVVSFSTTGTLPTGIVAGQRYYVQYGSITASGINILFQISNNSTWGLNGNTVAKGTPIATSGTQSGTHYLTTYGESWTDFILDPGVYFASANQPPGPLGMGIKKWRLFGYGARIGSNVDFLCASWNDVNANAVTNNSNLCFSAPFQSTNSSITFPSQVTLITPALAANFHVNSWVVLMALEMLHREEANWDPAIFEFARIRTVDPATGIITFYDNLQYNYRSTYPVFPAPVGSLRGVPIGPATMVQMSEVFEQQIEIHGLNIHGRTQQSIGGVLSVKLIDCDIWGWGYKAGPSPTLIKSFAMIGCRIHFASFEIDKMIDLLEFIDCDFESLTNNSNTGLVFQSASINKCVLDRCRLPGQFSIQAGLAQDMTIRDSFIGTLAFGCQLGATNRITLINTHISITRNEAGGNLSVPDVTFVNGTLKIAAGHYNLATATQWQGAADSVCPAPWACPGAKITLCHNGLTTTNGRIRVPECMGMIVNFTVLDVWEDGSNSFCIDTDLPALPNTHITITGTISGTTLNVTAISPAGACLLTGMQVTGTGLPNGVINNFTNPTGGSGYVNGTYTSVPVTGGTGSGAVWSSITVAGGAVTAATLGALGTGYTVYDLISASNASLGGSGSGFSRLISGTDITSITNDVGIPNATNNLGNYTLSQSGGSGTTFTASIPMSFLSHNCPRLTVINCTGGRFVSDMAGAPPDIPMFSYFKRAFAGFVLNSAQAESLVRLAGNLKYWDIDVQKPYTGLETTYTCTIYIFGFALSGGITYPTYITQVINVKTAGKRTISATTTSGSVAGDTLAAVPLFLSGAHNIRIAPPSGAVNAGDTLAQQPRIVMTAQTDQGIGFSSMFVYPAGEGSGALSDLGYDNLADQTTQAILW
jgi:hypothetical protein